MPAPSGADVLPLPPGGGFGFPNPLNPPNAINPAAPPLAAGAPAGALGLAAPGIGVVPIQANDPNAPAILIQPRASVIETFTDNVNFTASHRRPAAYTAFSPGVSISADTPRLQAVFTGSLNGYFYIPTSNFNQLTGSLYASGFGTVVPDALFVDARSVVTQSSALPGFGFQNLSQLPANQQTQVYSTTLSPYLRKSFDGLLDSELRYTFSSTNFGGNTTVLGTPTPVRPTTLVAPTTLSSSIFNEGTFIAATGSDFRRSLTRLTIDAFDYNASSTSRNKQFSAYDDLEYRITPQVAALARVGYQNIQYPFVPAATFVGATWLIGGRVGTYGPDPAYFALEYGRQQGVYGFTGSAQYNITPTMLFTASLVQGVSSPAQYIQGALGTSTLDGYGGIVDEFSGLPTAFYSPGIGLTNNVYRQHLLNMGITETIGPNHYSLYASYASQQALASPTTSAPTKTYGLNFTYNRDIRPDLNGSASLGYANSSNVITSTTATPINNTNQVTGYVGLNYLLGPTLTGSVYYSLSYFTNGAGTAIGRAGTGDVVVNSLTLQLSKTF
ncbi:MAG TPA: hypothetical protein VN849_03820 [Stellaceae bacterium]|nr:hypothetical protein [Stellaceae bacterium]